MIILRAWCLGAAASAVLFLVTCSYGTPLPDNASRPAEEESTDTDTEAAYSWNSPRVQADPERAIHDTWRQYLASKQGQYRLQAGTPSPHWLAAEQEEWPWYDLAGAYLPDSAVPEVMSIEAIEGNVYKVVTRFRDESSAIPHTWRSVMTVTVYAVRSDDRWVFSNALPRNTRSWRSESVGPITYVIQPGQAFSAVRGQKAVSFIDSLASVFALPHLKDVTYYMTSSLDEVYRIMGLESEVKYGPVGGVSKPVNRQLFSGIPAVGEEYRHELAHLVLMPLVGGSTLYFVSEGVATWIGGTREMDFAMAAGTLADFLTENPSVTLDSLISGRFGPAQMYPAGAVFTAMVFNQGGVAAVERLFASGPTLDDFRGEMERLFARSWPDIALDWRRRSLDFKRGASESPSREAQPFEHSLERRFHFCHGRCDP